MRKKLAVVALAGGVGLTGGMLIAPGLASAADPGSSTTISGRLNAIKDALKGLVTDGTITQSQADKVATTLDQKLPHRGMGGPGFGLRRGGAHLGPAAVAKVLGITADQLRTQVEAGKTLAQIAAGKGMSKPDLISGLVKAAEDQLATAVKDGRVTQAQADTIKGTFTARITALVDRVGPGPGMGRHRDGMMGPDGDAPPAGGTSTQPSSTGNNA